MKIFTLQHKNIIDIINREGTYSVSENRTLALNGEGFYNTYEYIRKTMHNHIKDYPESQYPIWGWKKYENNEGSVKDISILYDGFYDNIKEMVYIELDIPDNEILLSDFDKYSELLICGIEPSNDIIDLLDLDILDVKDSEYIQATFKSIKKENIIKIIEL